ncbi:MAG: hypothetical protein IPH11_01710 [Ignavibacteriales bacterium]|nr:hypothetical protein [Ignavibacteriales bacterium]
MIKKSYKVVDLIFSLFEDSKFFLNQAKINNANDNISERYSRASVIVSWAAFEGWINKTCDDFAETSTSLSVSESGFLKEKKVELKNGEFVVSRIDKYETTENKLEFLLRKFTDSKIDKSQIYWQNYKFSKDLRDSIMHPKKSKSAFIDIQSAETNFNTLKYFIDLLSRKLYNKKFYL